MSKTKFRDKGLSPTVRQCDQLMAAMPRYQVKEDDDHPEIPWREFVYGSMRGQYRELERQLDLLSVANLKPHNGHFRRLLAYAMARYARVRILYPHDRLRAHLIGQGFRECGDHVLWEGL